MPIPKDWIFKMFDWKLLCKNFLLNPALVLLVRLGFLFIQPPVASLPHIIFFLLYLLFFFVFLLARLGSQSPLGCFIPNSWMEFGQGRPNAGCLMPP